MTRASILRAIDTLVLRVLGLSPTTQKIGRSIRSKSNVLWQGASARRSSPFFLNRVLHQSCRRRASFIRTENRRHASTPGDRGKFLFHYTVERDRTRRGETAGLRSSHMTIGLQPEEVSLRSLATPDCRKEILDDPRLSRVISAKLIDRTTANNQFYEKEAAEVRSCMAR
jgi:hypothetical protein